MVHDSARRPARLRIWPFVCTSTMMAQDYSPTRMRYAVRLGWGRVRSRVAAIIIFTGTSTILIVCLAAAALNVVVRRESANVVEKQIQILVQASRSVAPAILDHAGDCKEPLTKSGGLKPLLAYTDEAFPQAQASLTVEGPHGVQSLLPGPNLALVRRPDWLPDTGFSGPVVERGQLEIRNVVIRQKGACRITALFSLPLGPELAKRLSSAANTVVTTISPRPFRVHSPRQRVLRTIEANFIPGISRPAAVVLTVRNWDNGALEDWIAYSVQPSYSNTFEDVARLGSQLANWVWLLAALSITVLLMDAFGTWMCIRLGSDIATAIDDLSGAARQIASGNFAWRTPVRNKDQLGDLSCNFNEMAIALERLQKEQAAALRLESELEVARSVQEYLYPRVVPVLRGATVAGRTLAARMVGGDLYDFLDLGQERIGILCADVSGKGIPAALMMTNLQAVARAHLGDKVDGRVAPLSHFVEILNQELTGRFGDNRYATLFWATFNTDTSVLTFVNAGNPPPILISPAGEIERLDSDGFPIGMFANARYTARELRMLPGSRLVIFSDGLTDAQNGAEEEFGDERLIACCKSIGPGIDAEGVAARLMQAVADWSAGTEQFDDTTVVVVDVAE
ncbi:MAG: phosphoserine phosphatase RsbU/P [Bryobacterales bacterium]|nr:phosphoserine phosphatase RsbU/P [Bryobacterales bacterium]